MRQTGGLGISIAGGKGSTPYKGDDEVRAALSVIPGPRLRELPLAHTGHSVSRDFLVLSGVSVVTSTRVVRQDVWSLRTAYRAAELFPLQTGFPSPFSHASSGVKVSFEVDLCILASCARALPVAECSPYDLEDCCSPGCMWGLCILCRSRPDCLALHLLQP